LSHSEKILIVGPSWVGDMVMAQTLFKLIRQQRPSAIIDVLAPEWSRPLLERVPEVHQSWGMPIGHGQLQLKQRFLLGKKLKQNQYQQAIVLPNSFKSALVPFFANIPQRTGWLGEMRFGVLNDIRYLNKTRLPLMVQRFMALGIERFAAFPNEIPYPCLDVNEDSINTSLAELNLTRETKPILALCPGAEFGPAKRWPVAYYAEIAKAKLKEGWCVWIFGSAKDQAVAKEIQSAISSACVDFTGKTSLAQAIDLLSLATVVVSNDSGLMHIAAALNLPLVVVYGSSDPRFTPPLSKQVKILSLGLSCSPCFQRECPLKENDHLRCLTELKPDVILNAVNTVVAEKKLHDNNPKFSNSAAEFQE
jgi:heptosyltransferase-2